MAEILLCAVMLTGIICIVMITVVGLWAVVKVLRNYKN